jgi:hypothetical protein
MQAAPPAIIQLILPVWFFLFTSLATKGSHRLSSMFCPNMINTRDQLLLLAKNKNKRTASVHDMHSLTI